MNENKTQTNNKEVKVLRTYTSDMAEVIRDNEISVIKIALAEKTKREQEETYKKAEGSTFSKILFIIGGVILIIGAIIGSYFLIQSKKIKPISNINNVETFISYDLKNDIDVTSIVYPEDFLNLIKNEQKIESKLIKALFLTKKNNNTIEYLDSKDFLSSIESTAPDALKRSLSGKYLLGTYSNQNATERKDKSSLFLIFETTNYPQTYSSMLEWEKTMIKDFSKLFDITEYNDSEPRWKDVVINNKDTRVVYGESGEGLLYYVFVNKNHFIITNDTEALKELTSRILTKNALP